MGQCLPDLVGTHVRHLSRETVVEPGEHLACKPVFATHITGRMNIDTLVVDLQPLTRGLRGLGLLSQDGQETLGCQWRAALVMVVDVDEGLERARRRC